MMSFAKLSGRAARVLAESPCAKTIRESFLRVSSILVDDSNKSIDVSTFHRSKQQFLLIPRRRRKLPPPSPEFEITSWRVVDKARAPLVPMNPVFVRAFSFLWDRIRCYPSR